MVRLLCLFGRHQRLGRAVIDDGRVLRSRCRHCGAPMVKEEGGAWSRDRDPSPPPPVDRS